MGWTFETIAEGHSGRIGGIAWDGSGLLFSVPNENVILRYSPATGDLGVARNYTNHITGLALANDGRLFACQEGSRRIIQLHDDGSASQLAFRLDGKVHNHPRDVAVDSRGRVWFCDCYSDLLSPGPKIWPRLDHASVLRQDRSPQLQSRSWTIRRMTQDTRSPQALLLSTDETTLYVAESDNAPLGRRELRAYSIVDDYELGTPIVLHTFGSDHRGPHRGIEGMCLDAHGNIVACAGWRRSGPGPVIMVIEPSGMVLGTFPVPGDRPTRCAFGDADLSALYIGTEEGTLLRVRDSGLSGLARFRIHQTR